MPEGSETRELGRDGCARVLGEPREACEEGTLLGLRLELDETIDHGADQVSVLSRGWQVSECVVEAYIRFLCR